MEPLSLAALVDRYDALVVDIDGVVVLVDDPIPGGVALMNAVADAGLPVVYVTNNSTRTLAAWEELLRGVGAPCRSDLILTSAMAAAALLQRDDLSPVHVVGEEGLFEALALADIDVTEEMDVAAVVVGFDRRVTWDRLRRATIAIHRGARFVATNPDPYFPASGELWPGNGATVAFLATATGVDPVFAGKPHRPLFELAQNRVGAVRPLMVGDQLLTDIAGAVTMGWDSLLVRGTGVAGVEARRSDVTVRPTYEVDDLAELL